MAATTASKPHTKAWTAFEQNLDSLAHMLDLRQRELAVINTAAIRFATSVTRLTTEVTRLKTLVGKPPDLPVLPLETAATKLLRSSERYTRIQQTGLERLETATLWQVVILVTCVEAYLQDLLALAASLDPKLMGETQQVAPYADVISATSLDDLASELRARWARKWLSKGGPKLWISRLKSMGARGYPDGLAPRLELIWGIRQVVVHAAGVIPRDFVKRHPGVGIAGDRMRVTNRDFGVFIESSRAFWSRQNDSLVSGIHRCLPKPSWSWSSRLHRHTDFNFLFPYLRLSPHRGLILPPLWCRRACAISILIAPAHAPHWSSSSMRQLQTVKTLAAIVSKHENTIGLLLVWWTPTYANSAFISNSMGLRYPSVTAIYVRISEEEVAAAMQGQADRFFAQQAGPVPLPALAQGALAPLAFC